jgi:hypothetical protein
MAVATYSFIFLASSMLKILSSSPQISIIFCNHREDFITFLGIDMVGFLSPKYVHRPNIENEPNIMYPSENTTSTA